MKQFEPTPFLDFLSSIYKDFEADKWVNQNALPFSFARQAGLAIAGSIAIAIARKKAIKKPGDIDFVTDDIESALHFIRLLERKMLALKSYWSVSTNNLTDFCPKGCTTHFRVKTAFWMPICVMVIPQENFQVWRTYGGHIMQSFDKVREAAEQLDERDNKGRISLVLKDEVIDESEPYDPLNIPQSAALGFALETVFTPLETKPTGSDYCQQK